MMLNIFSMNNLLEPVEMGLSGGEVRQSILDRANQNIKNGETDFIRRFIREHTNKIFIPRTRLSTIFENLLYDLNNEELLTEYNFKIDPIVVVEELD